jgi:hypothetical protein
MYDSWGHIDNNCIENAIKPIDMSVVKTSCLPDATKVLHGRAAVIFTFADQCKRHNLEAHRWLTHFFETTLISSLANIAT